MLHLILLYLSILKLQSRLELIVGGFFFSLFFSAAHGRRLAIRFVDVQTRPLHTENLCWNYCVELMCLECRQVRR